MGQTNLEKLQKKVKKELDHDRYQHTLGVMYTAAALAMRYQENLENAQIAGLLHDCAKCIPNDKKIRLCKKYGLPMTEIEHKAPFLLHAKLGAYLARAEYGVENTDVLNAIYWHTTGRPAMSTLEKMIFIADYIEPLRFKARNLSQIRQMAFIDLDQAAYLILRDTLTYLKGHADAIDTMTQSAYEYYKQLTDTTEENHTLKGEADD